LSCRVFIVYYYYTTQDRVRISIALLVQCWHSLKRV